MWITSYTTTLSKEVPQRSWCSSKSVLASFLHSLVDDLRIKKKCCQKKDVTSRSQYLKVMLYVGWVRGTVVYDNSIGGR